MTNDGAITGDWVGTSGPDTMTNESTGSVTGDIIANQNLTEGASGGGNTIHNHGAVSGKIYGSYNQGDYSSGGNNIIHNHGTVGAVPDSLYISICGSYNLGNYSSGGGNTINNTGNVSYRIYGSYCEGDYSRGGGNTINNYGTVGDCIYGERIAGNYSSGGGNTINNHGTVSNSILGSATAVGATGSTEGGNIIRNHGTVEYGIYGSSTEGGCSGGSNTIYNYATVGAHIIGSYNRGTNASGGGNTIVNTGTVGDDIYGSYNYGADSSGGGNYIYNYGTVSGDIYGSNSSGTGSSSGGAGNTIYNFGTVGGGIYGGDADDTVVIGWGSTVGGVIDGQDGYDILGFYNMGSFDPTILGGYTYQNFESYGFVGGGNTLNVDWDTGAYDLSVTNGYLYVAGGVTLTTNDLYVYSGGVLGGNGVIVGDVINQGVISPGNSAGTLTIDGNFINNGGTLLVELSRTSHDLLVVTGTATLNGGYVRASLNPDVYLGGESWTVLTADTVVGSFSGLSYSFSSATLSLDLSYSDSSVSVVLSRKPYADFATSAFESVVGAALDDIIPLAQSRGGYMADLIMAMDFGYSAAQITQALQALMPDMYPAYAFAQLESAGLAADAVDSRLDQARNNEPVSPDTATTGTGVSVWAKAVGAHTSLDASQGWPGYDQTLAGLISGADYALNPHLRLGLAVGYTVSDLSWDQSSYIGDMKTLHLLAYGGGEWNDFYAQASAGIAWHEADAQRDIDLASPIAESPRPSPTRPHTWPASRAGMTSMSAAGVWGRWRDCVTSIWTRTTSASPATWA